MSLSIDFYTFTPHEAGEILRAQQTVDAAPAGVPRIVSGTAPETFIRDRDFNTVTPFEIVDLADHIGIELNAQPGQIFKTFEVSSWDTGFQVFLDELSNQARSEFMTCIGMAGYEYRWTSPNFPVLKEQTKTNFDASWLNDSFMACLEDILGTCNAALLASENGKRVLALVNP